MAVAQRSVDARAAGAAGAHTAAGRVTVRTTVLGYVKFPRAAAARGVFTPLRAPAAEARTAALVTHLTPALLRWLASSSWLIWVWPVRTCG